MMRIVPSSEDEWFVIWIPDNLFGQKWKKFRHFSNLHQKTKKCTCFIHDQGNLRILETSLIKVLILISSVILDDSNCPIIIGHFEFLKWQFVFFQKIIVFLSFLLLLCMDSTHFEENFFSKWNKWMTTFFSDIHFWTFLGLVTKKYLFLPQNHFLVFKDLENRKRFKKGNF